MRYLLILLAFLINIAFATTVNYVAVGSSQVVLNSMDGTNWNYIDLSKQFPNKDFTGVTYGNNLWVVVGLYGAIATSIDGNTWEDHSIQTSEYTPFRSIVYYHNIFYANTDYGIYQSLDGKIWSKKVDNIGFTITRLMIANNKLFGLGYSNVLQFTDSGGWAIIYKGDGTFTSIAYGNNTYVITSQDGIYTLTSNNGINWFSTYSSAMEGYRPEGNTSIFASNIFVAANFWGETSPNGLDWNYKALTVNANVTNQFQFKTMIYDGKKYLATGSFAASPTLLTSNDAINWYSISLPVKIPGYMLYDVSFRD